MADVRYTGGQFEGVTSTGATEATLEKILAALGGKGSSGGAKAQNMFNEAQKKGTAEINKAAKAQKVATEGTKADTAATEQHTKQVKKNKEILASFGRGLKGIFGGIGSAIGGVGKALLEGETSLGAYTQNIAGLIKEIPGLGAIAGPAQALVSTLDAQIEMTREVNRVGGALGEGFLGVMEQARKSRMSWESYTALMTDQSNNLALAFGSTTQGMQKFSSIMAGVKQLDMDFAKLGYNVNELGEYTAEYIELERLQGRLRGRSEAQLIKGAQDYLMQLDQLTKVTGLSRKQAAQALKEQTMDKRVRFMFAAMDEGAKTNVQGVLTMLKSLNPELEKAAMDILATNGAPLTGMGKSWALQNQELMKNLLAVKENRMSTEEFATSLREASAKAQQDGKTMGDTMAIAAAKGVDIFDFTFAMMELNTKGLGSLTDAQKEQQKQLEDAKKAAANFEQKIVDARNEIFKAMTPLFNEMSAAMGDFTQWLSSPEGLQKMKQASDYVSKSLTDLIANIKLLDVHSLFKMYVEEPLSKAGINIPGWVKDMFFGADRTAEVKALEATHKQLTDAIAAAEANGEDMVTINQNGKKIQMTLDGAKKSLNSIQSQLDERAEEGGWWQTLKDAMSWLGPIATAVAAGGLVYGAILGLKALLLGLSGVLAAFGVAPVALGAAVLAGLFLGTGTAILAAGKGIDLAGEGLDKIAKALDYMSNIKDTDQLKKVAGVLGEMADPLMGMAKGGVVASFIKEGALQSLADGINSFANVDPSKLAGVGPAIAALYEGTSKFTGDGAWEGFSKWVGSLFGGDNNFEKMAEGIKHFEGVDSSKLASLGTGLGGIAEFVKSISAAENLGKQVDAIDDLVDVMKDYRKEYNKMSGDMQSSFNMAVSSSGKETVEALNELNTVIKQLVYEQQESNKIGNKIVGAVNEGGAIG